MKNQLQKSLQVSIFQKTQILCLENTVWTIRRESFTLAEDKSGTLEQCRNQLHGKLFYFSRMFYEMEIFPCEIIKHTKVFNYFIPHVTRYTQFSIFFFCEMHKK